LTARYVERLEGENDFLRRALEQRDRDAAELRAALREALRMSARALPTSTSEGGLPEPPATAPEAPKSAANTEEAPKVERGASGPQRDVQRDQGPTAIWERKKGLRAFLLRLLKAAEN
jgi:hypothetical protein